MTEQEKKRYKEVEAEIKELVSQINELNRKITRLKTEKLSLRLSPLKLGDKVYYEVPCGRNKKETICIIEEGTEGFARVRPYTKDGILSSRSFIVCDLNKSYSEMLRKVEE